MVQVRKVQAKTTYVVTDHGIVGDGVTDNATAINALLASLDAGSTVEFPPGRYGIGSQVTWSSKKLHLRFAEGAVLVELSALSVALLLCTDGDGSTVDNITIEGIEDVTSFGTGTDSTRYGVCFSSTDNGWIRYATISGKSKGIGLLSCNDTRVIEPTVQGLFSSAPSGGANYHSAVWVTGTGKGGRVVGLKAKNVGAGLTTGAGTVGLEMEGGEIDGFYDNGVYLSSGTGCKIRGVTARNGASTSSSGFKARGSGHILSELIAQDVRVGYTLTGNGGVGSDPYITNGRGTILSNSRAENCELDGLLLDEQDDYFARHVKVSKLTLINTASNGGGFAAIRGWAEYAEIEDITVETCGGTTAAVILSYANPGGSGAPSRGTGLKARRISIAGSAGNGVRIGNADKVEVSEVTGTAIAGGTLVDCNNIDSSDILRNRCLDVDNVVVDLDSNSDNCRVIDNYGARTTGRSHIIGGSGHIVKIFDRGTPEGFIAAAVGSEYSRAEGGAGTSSYRKETGTGNTGWAAK